MKSKAGLILFFALFSSVVVCFGQPTSLRIGKKTMLLTEVDTLGVHVIAGGGGVESLKVGSLAFSVRHGKPDMKQANTSLFSSNFYETGPQNFLAPLPKLYLQPANISALGKLAAHGKLEPHPRHKGYYYLLLDAARFKNGTQVLRLCNELQESGLAIVAEPVSVLRFPSSNPLLPNQWALNNTGQFNGTPGTAALALSTNPDLSASEVRSIIESTCDKIGGYTYTTNPNQPNGSWAGQAGYGRINVLAALQKSVTPAISIQWLSCNDGIAQIQGLPNISKTWSGMSGIVLPGSTGNTIVTTNNEVHFTGNFGGIQVTRNVCNQTFQSSVDINPYHLNQPFQWVTPPPLTQGDQIAASINPAPNATNYKWYLNGNLVLQGPGEYNYSTGTYGHSGYINVPGINHLKVDVVTDCGTYTLAEDTNIEFYSSFRLSAVPVNFSVFPNPSNGVFTISFTDVAKAARKIIVRSWDNSPVWRSNTTDKSVLVNLPKGAKGKFVIQVIEGNKMSTQQIIIQ